MTVSLTIHYSWIPKDSLSLWATVHAETLKSSYAAENGRMCVFGWIRGKTREETCAVGRADVAEQIEGEYWGSETNTALLFPVDFPISREFS